MQERMHRYKHSSIKDNIRQGFIMSPLAKAYLKGDDVMKAVVWGLPRMELPFMLSFMESSTAKAVPSPVGKTQVMFN